MDFIKAHLDIIAAGLAFTSLVLHAVAPRTKNTYDDKAASWVDRLFGFVKRRQEPTDPPA